MRTRPGSVGAPAPPAGAPSLPSSCRLDPRETAHDRPSSQDKSERLRSDLFGPPPPSPRCFSPERSDTVVSPSFSPDQMIPTMATLDRMELDAFSPATLMLSALSKRQVSA